MNLINLPPNVEEKLHGKRLEKLHAEIETKRKELDKLENRYSLEARELRNLPVCTLVGIIAHVRFNDMKQSVNVPDGNYHYEILGGGDVLVHCPKTLTSWGIPQSLWKTAKEQFRVTVYA